MASATPQAGAEQTARILTLEWTIIAPVTTLSAMYFVYGIYIFLFGMYLYTTLNSAKPESPVTGPKSSSSKLYLYPGLTTILFILSTIFVVFYAIQSTGRATFLFDIAKNRASLQSYIRYGDTRGSNLGSITAPEMIVPIFLNITAERMLIHRCYTIWNFNKRVGVPLIVASVVVNGTGLIAVTVLYNNNVQVQQLYSYSRGQGVVGFVYSISSTIMNSILAFLTAGRIWWIHRQVRAHDIHTSDGLVRTVCEIILESGILYPLFQVVNLVNVNFNIRAYPHPMPFDWTPIAVLSAGFAPTLVMVRAKLGKKVESLRTGESAFSDIRFNRPDIVSGSESTSRDAGGVERMRRV